METTPLALSAAEQPFQFFRFDTLRGAFYISIEWPPRPSNHRHARMVPPQLQHAA